MGESNNKNIKWGVPPISTKTFFNKLWRQTRAFIPGGVSEDIEILKRLQREAFQDLMKMRGKLEKIEKQLAFYISSRGSSFGGAKTELKGEIKAGGAFLLMQDESSEQSYSLLEQARMKTGTEVKFTFETFFRESDILVTECIAAESCMRNADVFGGPLTLAKVLYSANINENLSLSIVPVGAKGKDIALTLNPLEDQALTGFFANGPDHFKHCQGSALGVTIKGSNLAISMGKYISDWAGHSCQSLHGISNMEVSPVCSSTLGQVVFQPSEGIKFACSCLNRHWQSPSHHSSTVNELGPFIFSNIKLKGSKSCDRSSSTSFVGNQHSSVNSIPKKISTQSVSFSLEAEFSEGMHIGGWLQMERGAWMQELGRKPLQWAVCLSEFPEDDLGWGISVGQLMQYPFNTNRSKETHCDPGKLQSSQIQMEAFLKFKCGKGFTLQPGLLYMTNKDAHIPAFMLRSTWSL